MTTRSLENMVIIVAGLATAYVLYNKVIKPRFMHKALSGTLNTCEELARNLKMSEEHKQKWIKNCVDRGGDMSESEVQGVTDHGS